MMAENRGDRSRLRTAAKAFLKDGSLERSPILRQLFQFLLERSIAGEVPKEIEIAHAVFAHKGELDPINDTTVRSSVHRLRKKLAEFNQGIPAEADRIVLPIGSYELRLVTHEANVPSELDNDRYFRLADLKRRWILALATVLLAIGAAWLWVGPQWGKGSTNALLQTSVWQTFSNRSNPVAVVVGDQFVRRDGVGQASEVQPGDRSRASGDRAESRDEGGESGLYQVPLDVAISAHNLINLLQRDQNGRRLILTSTSRIDLHGMADASLIYVGALDSMALFFQPVFASSRYEVDTSYRTFTDQITGAKFAAGPLGNGQQAHESVEYAYLGRFTDEQASYLIVSGTNETAVFTLTRLLGEVRTMKALEVQAASSRDFEALYAVHLAKGEVIGTHLERADPVDDRLIINERTLGKQAKNRVAP